MLAVLSGEIPLPEYKCLVIEQAPDKRRAIVIMPIEAYGVQEAILPQIVEGLGRRTTDVRSYCRKKANKLDPAPLRQMVERIQRLRTERGAHCLKVDIRAFYPSISKEYLEAQLRAEGVPGDVIELAIRTSFQSLTETPSVAEYADGREKFEEAQKGLLQGTILSPHLANSYLFDVDMVFPEESYFRYMDDIAIMCPTRQECEEAHALLRSELSKLPGLTIDDIDTEKCHIFAPEEDIDILGLTLTSKGHIRPRKKAITKFSERVVELCDVQCCRTIRELLTRLNNFVEGWSACYGWTNMSQSALRKLDGIVRRYLTVRLHSDGLIRRSESMHPSRFHKLGVALPSQVFARVKDGRSPTIRFESIEDENALIEAVMAREDDT